MRLLQSFKALRNAVSTPHLLHLLSLQPSGPQNRGGAAIQGSEDFRQYIHRCVNFTLWLFCLPK